MDSKTTGKRGRGMTRQEAIERLKSIKSLVDKYDDVMALREAIKALEREPCEDAISRQAAIDAFGLSEKTRKYGGDHSGYDTMMLYEIQQTLEDLPSVTPKQRTGHWIECEEEVKCFCSECKEISDYPTQFCPNCGAKMEEPQESEGKYGGV